MTELILTKEDEENRGRNNYFLVMNVLGIIDEQHVEETTKYLFTVNF